VGILCWKSYKTVENTLKSYRTNGLFDLCKSIIYFQEKTPEYEELAKKYGVEEIMGTPQNLHILKGFLALVEATKTPYMIFAECDFELVHDKVYTEKVLQEALHLLEEKGVDMVKLRDREKPGEPLYSRQDIGIGPGEFADDIPISPDALCQVHKLETLHYLKEPEKKFPGVFEVIDMGTGHKWYKCSEQHNEWSNNIFIAKMTFLRDRVKKLLDESGKSNDANSILEDYLSDHLKGYSLAGGPGLFTHNRLDRG
jgi:hypothetical protein